MLFKRKACYLLIGFFYLITLSVSAQDQRIADSLLIIYKSDNLKGVEKILLR